MTRTYSSNNNINNNNNNSNLIFSNSKCGQSLTMGYAFTQGLYIVYSKPQNTKRHSFHGYIMYASCYQMYPTTDCSYCNI